jgi:hypothetical protein
VQWAWRWKTKSGHLQRLVYDSMDFRAMNVREARSPSLSGRRLRMSRYANSSNLRFNFIWEIGHSKGFKLPEIAPTTNAFRAKNRRIYSVVRSIRLALGMAGLSRKCVLVQRGVSRHAGLTVTRKQSWIILISKS